MAFPKRLTATVLAMAIVASLPLAALAEDAVERDRSVTDAASDVDRPVTDRPVTDRPVTDRPVTDRPVTDRPVTDRPVTDRPVTDLRGDVTDVRRCIHLVDHPRRCADGGLDDPHYVRHLIWRLVHAQEWKKLVRLLHALGWL